MKNHSEKNLYARKMYQIANNRPRYPPDRLQFPSLSQNQQKKHFYGFHNKVKFGDQSGITQSKEYKKRHNTLDVTDIEGARPRNQERNQKMSKYYNGNWEKREDSLSRILNRSQQKPRKLYSNLEKRGEKKSLQQFMINQRLNNQGLHEVDRRENQLSRFNKRIKTEPIEQQEGFSKKQSRYKQYLNEEDCDKNFKKKMHSRNNIFKNPTYLSNLFLM